MKAKTDTKSPYMFSHMSVESSEDIRDFGHKDRYDLPCFKSCLFELLLFAATRSSATSISRSMPPGTELQDDERHGCLDLVETVPLAGR